MIATAPKIAPQLLFLLAGLLLFPPPAPGQAPNPRPAAETVTFTSLLQELSDLDALTRPLNFSAGMVSTWDRTGGNHDSDNFLKVQGKIATLAELNGPGVITRIFSAQPGAGQVRIFLDHRPQPLLDLPAAKLFSGEVEPFRKPLVDNAVGNYSYLPIPFAEHCRIQIVSMNQPDPKAAPDFGLYWQVSYRRYPPGTAVQSLTLPVSEQSQSAWPKPEDLGRPSTEKDNCQALDFSVPTQNKKDIQILDLPGRGILQSLHITAPEDYLVEISWDGEASPSLTIPVPYLTIPFPMPFRSGASIRLACDGPCRAETVPVRLTLCSADTVSDYRLHAWFHQEWTPSYPGPNLSSEHNYRILHAQGRGQYVGTLLMVWNRSYTWWGEGDEMVFVDHAEWPPSFHGTGTEDYFDGAWMKFGRSAFAGALIADSLGHDHAGKTLAYRWHLADPIPFNRTIDFSIEHGSTNELNNLYASIAYWYQAEPHPPQPKPPAYAERKLDEKQLEKLVGQGWLREILALGGKTLRITLLAILALLALVAIIYFGIKMLHGKK